MTNVLQRLSPAAASIWISVQSRIPSILLTLSSLELTLAMLVGMFLTAAKRRNRLA